jgi:putative transposase
VERLWRSVKYEEVYLKAYQDVPEARTGIGAYMRFYNEERPHQALGYRTPREVFEEGRVSPKFLGIPDREQIQEFLVE